MCRRSRLLVAMLAVGCVLLGAASGIAAAQQLTTLEVEVVDQNGSPLSGVAINATWDGGSNTVTTAANGRAFVDVPEGEDVDLHVTDDDYVRNHPYVVKDAAGGEVTVDMARKGSSTVVVRDVDGQPLENATVEFKKQFRTDVEGETDEEGRFETGTIEQGEYRITAVKPGYRRSEIEDTVGANSRQEFELERDSVRLEVTVVDDHFEEPQRLEEARVRIDDERGEVATVRATGGTASLDVGVNTLYTVTVQREGYLETSQSVRVHESDRSVQVATSRVPTLVLEPQNQRVVVGEQTVLTVVNAYGEPVEGAEIIRNNETVGRTDENGELVVTIEARGQQGFQAVTDERDSEVVAITGVEADDDETTPTTTPTETGTDTEVEGPGFGAALAALALLTTAFLYRRR